MTGVRTLLIAPKVAQQMREARRWWVENRPKAPRASVEELRRGFELLTAQPLVGSRASNVRLEGVRRIDLSRFRSHLYYRASESSVEVLAFWHGSRGKSPPLQSRSEQSAARGREDAPKSASWPWLRRLDPRAGS